jgi:hypothetical protein
MLRYALAAIGCATLLFSRPAFAVSEDYMYPGVACRPLPWAIAGSFLYFTSPAGLAYVQNDWENNGVACPFRMRTYSTQTYGINYVGLTGYHNFHTSPVSCTLTIRQGNGTGILYSETRDSPTTPGIFHLEWTNIPSGSSFAGGIYCGLPPATDEGSDDYNIITSYEVAAQ